MNLNLALCQINPIVANIEYNFEKICTYIEKAISLDCKVICFPELCFIGYPPEDIVFYLHILDKQYYFLEKLKEYSDGRILVVGFVDFRDSLYNSAAILIDRKIYTYDKIHLPNYGVFDEERYFKRGDKVLLIESSEKIRIGITICEDLWYPNEPLISLIGNNVDLVLNISASPYYVLKPRFREQIFRSRAIDYSVFIAMCNMVGGQDELVFDGSSCVIDNLGNTISRAPSFEEFLLPVSINIEKIRISKLGSIRKKLTEVSGSFQSKIINCNFKILSSVANESIVNDFFSEEEEIFKACVLGTRDYVKKNNFNKVLVAMSGGIDSSLVSCIAHDALGKENVLGISLPSMFSSSESVEDAKILAMNLGINFAVIPISKIYDSFIEQLEEIYDLLGNKDFTVAEENLQARIRGNIIMTLSNKFGYLVLACGNKSEMSVGYATLYGDLAGGFAPIKDLYKTQVYKVARWYNTINPVIPERVFEKAPSAELRPNQTDQDSLPPYDVLDFILRMYLENNYSPSFIAKLGKMDTKFVIDVVNMVEKAEYKRRQAPPGIKITYRAFGKDRRFPISKIIS